MNFLDSSDKREPYLVGLLLLLIVLAAVPVFATGVTWLAVILLLLVWTSVAVKGKS